MTLVLTQYVYLGIMFTLQTLIYTIVSRARNRSSKVYGWIASVASALIYVYVFRLLVPVLDNNVIIVMYALCSGNGASLGMYLSERIIEPWFNSRA